MVSPKAKSLPRLLFDPQTARAFAFDALIERVSRIYERNRSEQAHEKELARTA